MKNKGKLGKVIVDSYFVKPAKLGDEVIITKTYFYNGEHHCKGYIKDNPLLTIDCPSIFINY